MQIKLESLQAALKDEADEKFRNLPYAVIFYDEDGELYIAALVGTLQQTRLVYDAFTRANDEITQVVDLSNGEVLIGKEVKVPEEHRVS